jgi:hypothetical protein
MLGPLLFLFQMYILAPKLQLRTKKRFNKDPVLEKTWNHTKCWIHLKQERKRRVKRKRTGRASA